MFESNPFLAKAFGGVIELLIFLLTYSIPLLFGVIVLAALIKEWLICRKE